MIRIHIRIIVIAAIVIALSGCAYWSGASPRDVATMALYAVQRKELVFVRTPCTRADKPALVSAWVREKDISSMVVACDAECNCRLTKKTAAMKIAVRPSESGICQ